MISRRLWFRAAIGTAATLGVRHGVAQAPSTTKLVDTSNLFAMDQTAARSVRRPPKPNATPSMTPAERDELEHRIRCQCGCTLSVYICRTTDFTCQVSPAMHRDIIALVEGGYTAPEIQDAFVETYGELALMAPPKKGFNLLGYFLPGAAIAVAAVVLAVILRRWRATATVHAAAAGRAAPAGLDATPDELTRLEAAIRDDA